MKRYPRLRFRLSLALIALCLPGCTLANLRSSRAATPPAESITFVADGSGDLRQVSDTLASVVKDSHSPMAVQRVQWSHGKGAVFPDLYGADHQQAAGKNLAQQIVAQRQANPTGRICLVGYSSGAAVALAAAENLPERTLDRIVLLSPSVAARRDLRPALRSSREGIDSFNSEWDAVCLVLSAMGTSDGAGQAVAGRTGFVPMTESAQDKELYANLHQHFWQGPSNWSGHDGGHFGCVNREFQRNQVLPLLLKAPY